MNGHAFSNLLDRLALQELEQAAAAALDREDLPAWLALFHDDGRYEISAYSSELRKTIPWWQGDHAELGRMLAEVKQHVRDPACRRRVLGLPAITVSGDTAVMETSFAVYRTLPQGQTSLYVVGRYVSECLRSGGGWRYRAHRALLDTRMLDALTHLPL